MRETVVTSMRLEKTVVEWLDRKAEGSRRSRNDVVSEILEAAMEREVGEVATHLTTPVVPLSKRVAGVKNLAIGGEESKAVLGCGECGGISGHQKWCSKQKGGKK